MNSENFLSRKSELSHTFDYRKKPKLFVGQDEDFIVETEDNTSGLIKSEKDLPTIENLKPYTNFEPRKLNPINGPVYIEGAEKGDLLAVTIKKIIPAEYGITFIQAGFGPLAESKKWPSLQEDLTKVIKHIPGKSGTMRDGKAIYSNNM